MNVQSLEKKNCGKKKFKNSKYEWRGEIATMLNIDIFENL